MSDEPVVIEPVKKGRGGSKAGRKFKMKASAEISKRHMDVVFARAAGMTLQEAGESAGYPKHAACSSAATAMRTVREKLSNNSMLAEFMRVKGATLDKVATVCSEAMDATSAVIVRGGDYVRDDAGKLKKINTAKIEMVPDHRARLDAAKFTADILAAMPEKKIVMESRTFEAKVAIVAQIRENPQAGIAMIQELLQQKLRSTE
jgi:hypothetical protein